MSEWIYTQKSTPRLFQRVFLYNTELDVAVPGYMTCAFVEYKWVLDDGSSYALDTFDLWRVFDVGETA